MRRSKTRGRRGDHLIQDDRTGFTIWASEAQREWNGAIVHRRVFESRHPQDFVRGRKDNLRADPSRPTPEPEDLPRTGPFVTALAEDAVAGDNLINVVDASGFSAGDWVRIYLDNGDAFTTRIINVGLSIDNIEIPIDVLRHPASVPSTALSIDTDQLSIDDTGTYIDGAIISIDTDLIMLADPLPWSAEAGRLIIDITNHTTADLGYSS